MSTEYRTALVALGDVLLDLVAEQPDQADALLPMIEQAWLECLLLGERPEQTGAVAGRGSHLADKALPSARPSKDQRREIRPTARL